MKLFRQTGQNAVEYMVLTAVVLTVILAAVGPNGFLTQSVNKTLDMGVNAIQTMAECICYPDDPDYIACVNNKPANCPGPQGPSNPQIPPPGAGPIPPGPGPSGGGASDPCSGTGNDQDGKWELTSPSGWGSCLGNCGSGQRTRSVDWTCVPPVCNGLACGPKPAVVIETEDCVPASCQCANGTVCPVNQVCINNQCVCVGDCNGDGYIDPYDASDPNNEGKIINDCDLYSFNGSPPPSNCLTLDSGLDIPGVATPGIVDDADCFVAINNANFGLGGACGSGGGCSACLPEQSCMNNQCYCVLDCNLSGGLDTNDTAILVGIIFGGKPISTCPTLDIDKSGTVESNEISIILDALANGCQGGGPVCGDAWRQGSEACDDGNTNDGDGCSSLCQKEACQLACLTGQACLNATRCVCGGDCDESGDVSTAEADYVEKILTVGCPNFLNCFTISGCPAADLNNDDLINQSEVDQAKKNNQLGCQYSACGNGSVDAPAEVCDDGNNTSGDGCSQICQLEACRGDCDGDGILHVNDIIKAENEYFGNIPAGSCPSADTDGSGSIGVNDLIALVNDLLYGAGSCSPQPTSCTYTPDQYVGDCDCNGIVSIDEAILAINISLGQQPLAACPQAEKKPPDGQITIDELVLIVQNAINACPSTPPDCGNSAVESCEECDDGNKTSGDGCSSMCKSELCGTSTCTTGQSCVGGNCQCAGDCDGNGLDSQDLAKIAAIIFQGASWTTCPSLDIDGDNNMTIAELTVAINNINNGCPGVGVVCGNGIKQNGEECDDNNATSGDGCSSSCQLEGCQPSCLASESCVNGSCLCVGDCVGADKIVDMNIVNNILLGVSSITACPSLDQDGNGVLSTGYPSEYVTALMNSLYGCAGGPSACGNGIQGPGEQCDDGNTATGDGCSPTCQYETYFTTESVTFKQLMGCFWCLQPDQTKWTRAQRRMYANNPPQDPCFKYTSIVGSCPAGWTKTLISGPTPIVDIPGNCSATPPRPGENTVGYVYRCDPP